MIESLKAWLIHDYRFLKIAKWCMYNFYTLLFGLKVEGREHVPSEGGVIIACNHFSNADPPVIGASTPRLVSFMAKKELFSHPIGSFMMEIMHAYPVDRNNSDLQSIKKSLWKLETGEAVGIFFEGRRNQGEATAREGAAFLAQRANVPIIPTAIWKEGWQYRVRFGSAILPKEVTASIESRKEKLHVLTQYIHDEVKSLRL